MADDAARLVPLDRRDEWDAALHGVEHAFAHTWEACSAVQRSTGWPTYLFTYESPAGTVVCPIAERAWGDAIDVVTPYGFSGFVGGAAPDLVLRAWTELARTRGYVCAYLGLNPVLGDGAAWAGCGAEAYNEVFLLDLEREEQELLGGLRKSRRRSIRDWERHGGPVLDDPAALRAFFLANYHGFMERRGAAAVYGFDLETLCSLLDLDRVVTVGAGSPSAVEAVAVFADTCGVGEWLFNISVPGAEAHTAVLLWEGARRLRRSGVRVLNLGGGVRPGDGVADFKRSFGASAVPLQRLRQVYDRPRFDALCRAAEVDPTAPWSYFPPYRRGDAR